jgi:carbamoyltransferase
MDILGLSFFYHDAAACLLREGEVLAAAAEERFSRKKHDFGFPRLAAEYCLREAGIGIEDVSYVGFYEKPIVKFDRILSSLLATAPRSYRAFLRAMPLWLREKLWIRELIKRELGYKGEVLFGDHHHSHAASAFYASPFEESAVLTLDGVGEWACGGYGFGRGTELRLLRELRFPHSLGMLYSVFTAFLGFEVNEGEYKVMGLAPYGRPRYLPQVNQVAHLHEDGSLWLDMRYFEFHRGVRSFGPRFVELFGPPRADEEDPSERHTDVAASIQAFCEEAMLRMARHVWKETKLPYLCLAGGVALNCVGNARILAEGPFRDLFVQPAAGDDGGSLGIAYTIWHGMLQKPRERVFRSPYLGPRYADAEIEGFLTTKGVKFQRLDAPALVDRVAELLTRRKVVGWFQGRMEFGPRALGNRSILADPRDPDMKAIVNEKIKFRELFRPFAPAVIWEETGAWLERAGESPYMVLTSPVRPEKRALVPAITHVDGSARHQTVRREDNPLFYDLLRAFQARTGVPILMNTSFNRRGEPIVCDPGHAWQCFEGSGLDALAIGPFLVLKS